MDQPKVASLKMVFESGRSAAIGCNYDEAIKLLESIANGEDILVPVVVEAADEAVPGAFHYFVRVSRVTHAVVVPFLPTSENEEESLRVVVPRGFHDSVPTPTPAERSVAL